MSRAARMCLQGKRVVVSGSGNVATFAIKKLLELGAVPITASDSTGYVYEKDGFTEKTLEHLIDVKVVRHGTLKEYKSGEIQCCMKAGDRLDQPAVAILHNRRRARPCLSGW